MEIDIDIHRTNASKLFGIAYENVTEEQRRVAKAWSFAYGYKAGEIKQGLLVGRYPIKYGE